MQSNQQLLTQPKHPLINLAPSIMVMPGTWSLVKLDTRDRAMRTLLKAARSNQAPFVFATMSIPGVVEAPDRYCKVGVVAEVEPDMKNPLLRLGGRFRAELLKLETRGNENWFLWMATVKRHADENHDDYLIENQVHIKARVMKIKELMENFLALAKSYYQVDEEEFHKKFAFLLEILDGFENTDWGDNDAVDYFIWAVISAVPDLLQEDKQPLVDSTSLSERIDMCLKALRERIKLLEAQKLTSSKADRPLRQARRVEISDSEKDSNSDDFVKHAHGDIKKRWEKFKEVREYMNEDARDVVIEDLEKLKSYGNPQGNTYEWPKYMRRLDRLLNYPWNKKAPEGGDIVKVEQILNEDHYGLEHPKGRISEGIAPRILNPEGKGQIICFVGPPGVGKTSLARSVARALGRKYIRMSVGGIRDEAQIRGHGITYIGAEPGEIFKLISRCGESNPVFVVDEIDKLGSMSAQGDPSAAMLEVFDPEQNNSFKDHYTSCGIDLSKVIFIATANVEDTIHPALRDRMDIIRLPGYLEVEKVEIAKKYLIPKWLKELGLIQNNVEVVWEEELISKLIRSYTHEAGVRGLEKNIATLLKKICRDYLKSKVEGEPIQKFEMTEKKVHEYLGPPKFTKDRARTTKVGEAIGLAWTPVGGDILYVQAEMYPRLRDKKVLDLTGMQGDVMKESDKVAMTILRNRVNQELSEKLSESAFHLHIPEGAVPKDGPSAGVTMFTALYSEVTDKLVKSNLAMTGEIDLKAKVLPVGGIREKIVAAERAGIEEVILPKENERNLHDVPKEVKDKLKFHFVETLDEVLEIAFPTSR